MEGLGHLTSLNSLWLGKNKIELIADLDELSNLRQLDVQSNRLTSITGLKGLSSLEELYLACNQIISPSGLAQLPTVSRNDVNAPLLSTLDLSSNKVTSLEGLEGLRRLSELWMTANSLASYTSIEILTTLPELSCLYLEQSTLSAQPDYRDKVLSMLPNLTQLDALTVSRKKVA